MPEVVGISTLGGGKRNDDTHSVGRSGDLLKLKKKKIFLSLHLQTAAYPAIV